MFSFFSKDSRVLVQPLYRNGSSLAFACESLLESDQGASIRDRDGHQADVQVQKRRRADDRTWIYFAMLLEGSLEPEPSTPGYRWRQADRHALGVRVRSPHLPGYSALTEDLSVEGALLQTSGPVQVGDEIELFLDLDNGSPAVQVMARVCWTRLTQPWRVGVSFLDLDPQSESRLGQYLAQQMGDSVLPGLGIGDSVPAIEYEPSVLKKMALLQSSLTEGNTLVVTLLTNDEVMEIRLPQARVLESNLTSRLVSRIVTQPTSQGRTHTLLLDAQANPLAQIESESPEIVCRGVRVHDLG